MLSLEYIAGFFDGEGSIGIYSNSNRRSRGGYCLRVQVTQNQGDESQLLLDELLERFGGCSSPMNRSGKRPAWIWQVNGDDGAAFLCSIRPYLRLKAEQADVAVAWHQSRPQRERDRSGRMVAFPDSWFIDSEAASVKLKMMKK